MRPLYHIGYLSYFELNIDYIIETYCVNKDKVALQCNANCHLTKQLSPVTNEKNTKGLTTIGEAFYPVFFQKEDYETDCLDLTSKTALIYNSSPVFKATFYFNCFHPPQS